MVVERYTRLGLVERVAVLVTVAGAVLAMAPAFECAARVVGLIVAIVTGGSL